MDAQDFRSLQEAYMEVVEGKVEWDNPKRPLQSGLTPREKNRSVRRWLERGVTGLNNPSTRSFTSAGPSERDYERYGRLTLANQEQSGLKTPKERLHKFKDDKGKSKRKRYKPVLGNLKEPKESYDIYDIILSHLLDEGYAETQKAAEAIMVNMSEEWREDIMEGYKRYPAKKVGNKLDRMYDDPDTDTRFGKTGKRYSQMRTVDSHMKGEVHPLIRAHSPKKSKAKETENRKRGENG